MQKSLENVFYEDAKKGAEKICNKNCVCPYSCNKPFHKKNPSVLQFGKGEVCPVEKYEVTEPDNMQNPFGTYYGRTFDVIEEELFSICTLCEYSEVSIKGAEFYLEMENCFSDYCIDCPVNAVRENIKEANTEYQYLF